MNRVFTVLTAFLLLFTFTAGFASAKQLTVNYNFPLDSGITDVSETVTIADDENAYTAFIQTANNNSLTLDISYYDFDGDGVAESAFVDGVNGISTSADWSSYWQFSVNNTSSMSGMSAVIPADGESISLDYLDGRVVDALEWLADNQNPDGSFGANLFQSDFGLMAVSLASDNNVSLDPSLLVNGINYCTNQQQADAGFGDNLNTALSIMALLSNGKELADFSVGGQTSIDLLTANQNTDGGFESGTAASDVDTTSWAAIAFVQANQTLPVNNGNSPVDYLLSAQHANGSWGYNVTDGTEIIDFSEEAIIALAAAGHPKDSAVQNALNWLSSKQDTGGCISDGFRTALGSIAFRMYLETADADNALNCLNTMQNGDGSFGRSSNPSNAIDTGIAVIALTSNEFPLTVSVAGGGSTDGVVGLNSTVKFLVDIQNVSNVTAENVSVTLQGVPSNWVLTQGSIDFFTEIVPGETRTAEIFVEMLATGQVSVQATVTTDTSTIPTTSNNVNLDVVEAMFNVSMAYQ